MIKRIFFTILAIFAITGCNQDSEKTTEVAAQDPRYAWVVDTWSECTISIDQACSGSGDQHRQVYCKKDPGSYVDESICLEKIGQNSKPNIIKQCKSIEGQIETPILYSGISVGAVTRYCKEGQTLAFQSSGYCTTGFRYVSGNFSCTPESFTLTTTSISPISPSNLSTNSPLIKGKTSSLVSNVSFYSDALCSNLIPIINQTNVLNLFNSSGINISLTPNIKQDIYIKMSNPTYFLSSCSLFSKDYVHDNRIPVLTITSRDNYINSINSSSYNLKGSCKDNFLVNFIKSTNNSIIKSQYCSNGTFDVNLDFSNKFLYPDGVFQLKLSQTDSANNIGEISVNINKDVETFVNLTTYPQIVNSLNQQSFPVSGTCDSGSIEFSVDAIVVGVVPCSDGSFSSTINLSPILEGSNVLSYKITDIAGNILLKSVSVNKDSVYPNLTISPLYGYINLDNQNSPYTVSGMCESNLDAGNVKIVRAESNQEIFSSPCVNSGFTYNFDFSSSLDQIYQYRVSQKDAAGNEKTLSFGVNKSSTKPSLYISATPAFANISNKVVSFLGECSIAGVVTISWGSESQTAQCSQNPSTSKFEFTKVINFSSYIDGNIDVNFSISDGVNSENKIVTVIKDTVAPSLLISNSSLYSNSSEFSLVGTCSENGMPIIITDPLDHQVSTNCISGSFSAVVSLLQYNQGPVLFNIKHTDSVQNTSTQVFSIIKDTISPLNASITYPIYIKTSTLPITINFQDVNPISSLILFQNESCSGQPQSVSFSSVSGSVYNYSHEISGLQNKYQRFISLKIQDAAGNQTECLNYNLGQFTYVNKLDDPSIVAINPNFPSPENLINIKGSVDNISSSIGIYSDSSCSVSLYDGPVNMFIGLTGQSITVSQNQRTDFYGKSYNTNYGLSSDCVNFGRYYVHDSIGPVLTAVPFNSFINKLNKSNFEISGVCEPNLFVDIKNLADQTIDTFICPNSGNYTKILDLSSNSEYPEGSNVFFKFQQSDDAQNTTSVLVNVVKDTIISLTNIQTASFTINIANQNSFGVSGICSDGVIRILVNNQLIDQSSCPVGGGTFSKTFNLSSAPDGNLNLLIELRDLAGNFESNSLVVQKDTIAPLVTFSNNPQYVRTDSDIIFKGACSEVGEKIDIINLYNNYHTTPDGENNPEINLCDETGHYSITMPVPNPESVMQFKIVHSDTSLNSTELNVSITKDKTPPLITSTAHQTYIMGPVLDVSISYTETLSGIDKIITYNTSNCSGQSNTISFASPSNSIFSYAHSLLPTTTEDAFFSYKLIDKAGNTSATCGFNSATLGKYTVINKFPAPVLTSISPASSPSSISSPSLIGSVGTIANQISFYSDSNCLSLINQSNTTLFISTGQTVVVTLNSLTSIYAKTSRSGISASSDCTLLVSSYIHDNIPPVVSSISHPKYTGINSLPVVINYSDQNGSSKIRTYSTINCSGSYVETPYGLSTGNVFNYFHGKSTSSFSSGLLSIEVLDSAGNVSACSINSATSGEYVYINSLLGPTLTNNPPGAGSSTTINLKGTSDSEADEIGFFTNSICSSPITGYVSKNNFIGTLGQDITISLNSTTSIYAKSKISGTSFESPCKFLMTYTQDSTPPVLLSTSVPAITSSMPISFTINYTEDNSVNNIYIYESAGCSGSPIVTSTNITGSSLTSTYSKNSPVNKTNYPISFRIADSAGNMSNCSSNSTVRFVNSLTTPSGLLSSSLNSSFTLAVSTGSVLIDTDSDTIQLYTNSSCSTTFGNLITPSQLSSGVSSLVADEVNLYGKVFNSSLSLSSSCSSVIGYGAIYPSLTEGFASYCAISRTNLFSYCWGLNDNGQLGIGNTTDSNLTSLVAVKNTASVNLNFINISMGKYHACGITTTGNAVCWGKNDKGQLGNGSSGTYSTTAVSVSGSFKKIYAGEFFSCGIALDDTVKCWGDNTYGQLGIGSSDSLVHSTPTSVNDSTKYRMLSLSGGGNGHACGITQSNQLKCWGANFNYQVSSQTGIRTSPFQVEISESYAKVATGWGFTCALLTNGSVKCWGANAYGQLGFGNATPSKTILINTTVPGTYKELSAGGNTVCAVTPSGTVSCWGENISYQIGQGSSGTNSYYASPLTVLGLTNAVDVKVSRSSVCAQKTTGEVTCWGDNSVGTLGDMSYTTKKQPSTQIPFIVK